MCDSLLVEWGKGLDNHYCHRIDNVTLKRAAESFKQS